MPTFLTVREAAQRYGKSPTSIRRAIYPIVRDDMHADRGSIEPSVEEALKLRVSGVSFPWRISEDLLARIVRTDAGAARGPMNGGGRPTATYADADFIAFLRSEVEIKNQQIARNDETIKALNERLRESNVLMATLQQRLALTDGRDVKSIEVSEPTTARRSPEAGSGPSPKAPKPAKAPKPKPAVSPPPEKKRGFLRWFT